MSFTLGLTLLAVAGAMGLAFAHGLSRCRRAPRHAARRFTSTVALPQDRQLAMPVPVAAADERVTTVSLHSLNPFEGSTGLLGQAAHQGSKQVAWGVPVEQFASAESQESAAQSDQLTEHPIQSSSISADGATDGSVAEGPSRASGERLRAASVRIVDKPAPGVGPTLVGRLRNCGIETYADFVGSEEYYPGAGIVCLIRPDGARVYVPGIGHSKAHALVSWQVAIIQGCMD